MNLSIKQKQTQPDREQTRGCQAEGERTEWNLGLADANYYI